MERPTSKHSAFIAPVANMAKQSASISSKIELSKKRKGNDVDQDTEAYFDKVKLEFEKLQQDADIIQRHEAASEVLPHMTAFHPSFSEAEQVMSGIVHGLFCTFDKLQDKSSEATYIKERLSNLLRPETPPNLYICFYGNCAVGKSSLVNATLAMADMSLKTGDGSVGTLVPLEFHQASGSQPVPIMLYVFMQPEETCFKIIADAVADIWNTRFAPNNDEAAYPDGFDMGHASIKILCTLFNDKDEFADEEAAFRFLATLRTVDDPSVLNKLKQWVKDILGELNKLGNTIAITAFNAIDMNSKLAPFSQTIRDPQIEGTKLKCSVWPLVAQVKIYLSNPLLSKGIVLVDIPGVSDSNVLRVNTARSYLRKCDHVIIVGNIERATDDQGIKKLLREVVDRKRYERVALALTRSDIIDIKECERLSFSEKDRGILASLTAFEGRVDAGLQAFKKMKLTANNLTIVEELRKNQLNEFYKKHIELKRTSIYVQARNERVKNPLQKWYHSVTKDDKLLPVFCVSSKIYMAHLDERPSDTVLPMFCNTTGIPALRSYLFSLAAKSGKIEAFIRYCVSVRSLLAAVELACMGSGPMKRESLVRNLNEVRMDWKKELEPLLQNLSKPLVEPVVSRFDDSAKAWLEEAKILCQRLESYHHQSFAAFLKRKGKWRTDSVGGADWNNTLINKVRDQVQPALDALNNDVRDAFRTEVISKASELADDLEVTIRHIPGVSQDKTFKKFFDNFRNWKKEMVNVINNAVRHLQTDLLRLNNDSLNDGEKNPFTLRMLSVYGAVEKAKPPNGKGAKRTHQKMVLRTAICNLTSGPYPDTKQYVRDNLDDIFEKAEERIVDGCNLILENIVHSFKKICAKGGNDNTLSSESRLLVGEKVKAAKKIMEGELQGHLQACGITLN